MFPGHAGRFTERVLHIPFIVANASSILQEKRPARPAFPHISGSLKETVQSLFMRLPLWDELEVAFHSHWHWEVRAASPR